VPNGATPREEEWCPVVKQTRSESTKLDLHDLALRIKCDAYIETPECAWFMHRGVSTLKIWRMKKKGPPWHWVNSSVVYRPSEVRQWMDAQRAGGAR
jgi:hypothetical protein